jgi:nicotinate-nucleotide pyrophosphorylase (carboxylating)
VTTARKKNLDACCRKICWEDLDLEPIRKLISLALEEDLTGSGLIAKPGLKGDRSSTLLDSDQYIQTTLQAREPLCLSGLPLAYEILDCFDERLELKKSAEDGEWISPGEPIATISGPCQSVLTIERTLLNFLQRLSGIATTTRRFTNRLGDCHTRLLDTRKTTPGYRYLEKYSVACGGGWNHRMGLFDRVMLKDNHLAAFGNKPQTAIGQATRRSRQENPGLLIEMEVDRLDQIDAALEGEVDIILLDNFTLPDLQKAQALINDRAVTEISGNVSLETIADYRAIGCDFISAGALVHKSVWVDIGLDWDYAL